MDAGATGFGLETSIEAGRWPARTTRMRQKVRGCLRDNLLLLLTLLGIAVGLGVGMGLRPAALSQTAIMWLGLPGEMFMQALRMMIVPLLTSSIIVVIASMDFKVQGRIATITIGYMIVTNFLGSILGAVIGAILQPGSRIETFQISPGRGLSTSLGVHDVIADLIRNLIPANIVQAAMYTVVTTYSAVPAPTADGNLTSNATEVPMVTRRGLALVEGTNVLGIVAVSIAFGLACSRDKERTRPFLDFFTAVSDIAVTVVRMIIWCLPVGAGSLVCAAILSVHRLETAMLSLGLFIAANITAVCVHQLLLLKLIFVVFARRNPFPIYFSFFKGWLTAFATCSSMASLPTLFQCSDRRGINKKVSRCVFPICVALNSDGSASFIALSCIFLAQLQGIPITVSNGIMIVLLTSVNVMALPSIPSSSLITVVIVCTAIKIPAKLIALLFTTEFLLDRLRTATNVTSHVYCCAIVDKICRRHLDDDAVTELQRQTLV